MSTISKKSSKTVRKKMYLTKDPFLNSIFMIANIAFLQNRDEEEEDSQSEGEDEPDEDGQGHAGVQEVPDDAMIETMRTFGEMPDQV
jgi:hypothetical protein